MTQSLKATSINYAWNKWQSVKVPGEEAPSPAWSIRKSFSREMRPELLLFAHSVVSNSLRPHELRHTRLPWPSPSPKAYSNSCPLSQWCYPTIPSFVIPFHSCLQSFPASGSFLMSYLFASGSQPIGASVSTSVLPMNIQDWFPLGLTGSISLQYKGLSRVSSNSTDQKHQFFGTQSSLWSSSHICTWLLENP